MSYDLILNVAPKDIYKVSYCLNSIKENFDKSPDNIFLVGQYPMNISGTTWISDSIATPFSKNKINFHRQGWIFQQLVKIFPTFIENDEYMVVDSDVIFNKPLIIDKIFYISNREQCHGPYFEFMKRFGIERVSEHTFINDFMYFSRKICQEMTGDPLDFFDKMNTILSEECYPAEFEMYGNYVTAKYPDLYKTIYHKVETHGLFYPSCWTNDSIEHLIKTYKNSDIDLFTIHTWT
jgi:hypothetical protein